MAKRPTAKPTDPPDPATEAKAQRMISNVRSHYDRGRRANSSDSELSTVEFAAANGVNVYTMRKDRRFARLYSEDQVTVLLALRRPNGLPLHWGHVEYLLQIEGADERRKFGERAARQGWSAQQLRVAIQGKFGGKGSGHGSRIKPPANAEAGLLQLIEASEGMRARCRVVMEKLAQAGNVSARLARQAAVTAEELQLLETVVRKARKELEELAERPGTKKKTAKKTAAKGKAGSRRRGRK
jgi:hypothetical protein